MVIHNVTRDYHDAIVKCEVYNEVGKSEETKTLDVTCEYNIPIHTYTTVGEEKKKNIRATRERERKK